MNTCAAVSCDPGDDPLEAVRLRTCQAGSAAADSVRHGFHAPGGLAPSASSIYLAMEGAEQPRAAAAFLQPLRTLRTRMVPASMSVMKLATMIGALWIITP